MDTLPRQFRKFQEERVALWKAYEVLGQTAAQAGPLEEKTRALIKLGMAAARGAESAVHSHTHRALAAGAAPEEIEHAVLVGITTIGFPAMMRALSWAREAIENESR